MAGLALIEGLGLILGVASAPAGTAPAVTPISVIQGESAGIAQPATQHRSAQSLRVRTRDERIGTMALRGYPSSQSWTPPAQSWGQPGQGPVVEIGALGAAHAWQPDLAHLSLQWQF